MKIILVGTALLAGCMIARYAYAQSAHTGLSNALKNGDASKVEQIIRTKSVNPHIARIAHAQLNYDMPQLLRLGRNCQTRALKGRDWAATTEALYCYGITLSAATSIGDPHEVLSELLWYKECLLPRMKKHLGNKPLNKTELFANIAHVDLKNVVSDTPNLSMEWVAESKRVPVNHMSSFSLTVPKFNIDVNGRNVVAMIDTRLPAPAPIIIIKHHPDNDENDSNLGLIPIYSAEASPANKASAKISKPELEWKTANTVTIGPLVLHHLLVLVGNNNNVPAGIYIKNALLRQFGEVVISKGSVLFSRHSIGDCKTGANMAFAADKNLNGILKFPITVDGRKAAAAFYSDNPTPFQTAYGVLSAVTPSAGFADSTYTTRRGPIHVKVGSETFEASYAIVANQRSTGPVDALIGNPVLQSHSVHLIFDHPPPVICLSKANQ